MSALKILIQKEKPDLICLNEIKCLEQEANGDINVLGLDSVFIGTFDSFLLIGDLNSKLPHYNKNTNQNGLLLDNLLQDINACVLNNKNYPTNFHITNDSTKTSIIDLIIASSLSYPLLKNCIVLKESAIDIYQKQYYYLPILVTLNLISEEKDVQGSKNKPYNYQKADWSKFKQLVELKLSKQENSLFEKNHNQASRELMKILNEAKP